MEDFTDKRRKENSIIPVTLLSGFLGSGKTTLLMNILRNKENLRCAIIVNDMASINIDGEVLSKGEVINREEELVEMQNGCICCTLRGDLLKEVTAIAKSGNFDYIIIESTGISEPMQVAETFAAPPEALINDTLSDTVAYESLLEIAQLDTCVTVIDSFNFFDYMDNTLLLNEGLDDGRDDVTNRTISNLLCDQIEFSNVIIVNKKDLVDKDRLDKIKGFVKTINPSADIIFTSYCGVPLNDVLHTGKFDFEAAQRAPGWFESLIPGAELTPETEEYGISSFVYRTLRPFHPNRLYKLAKKYFYLLETKYVLASNLISNPTVDNNEIDVIEEKPINRIDSNDLELRTKIMNTRASSHWHGLMRSKGYFCLATRPNQVGNWGTAGTMLNVEYGGVTNDENVENEYEQKLVFIGSFTGKDKQNILQDLESCLLNEYEMELLVNNDLGNLNDPWKPWPSSYPQNHIDAGIALADALSKYSDPNGGTLECPVS